MCASCRLHTHAHAHVFEYNLSAHTNAKADVAADKMEGGGGACCAVHVNQVKKCVDYVDSDDDDADMCGCACVRACMCAGANGVCLLMRLDVRWCERACLLVPACV